jgi:predicted outer membrane protein
VKLLLDITGESQEFLMFFRKLDADGIDLATSALNRKRNQLAASYREFVAKLITISIRASAHGLSVSSNGVSSMSRNVVFTAVVVALTSSLALFADPKVRPDPVGPGQVVAEEENPATRATPVTQANPGQANVQRNGQWQWKNPDHALASCVALGNQEEIAMGQFASQKAQNEDVKKFAQMLVQDHQEFLMKLKPFAAEVSAPGYLNSDVRAARTTNAAPATQEGVQQAAATTNDTEVAPIQTTAGTQPAEGMKSGYRHLQIERELAQQCLATAKEKLGAKTGAEFDKCFVGMQIAMHMGMRSKLIVYQRHASKELAPILAAGQQKTEEHLAKAEELMKDLEQGSASTTSTNATKSPTNVKADAAKEDAAKEVTKEATKE